MFVLVTQTFGRESEYRRAQLAILSFWAWYKGDIEVKTVIFTDNFEWFKSALDHIPVQYVTLTAAKIRSMRGEIDFIHRMKIALIAEVYQLYPGRSILYIDSDTFFMDNPAPLLLDVLDGKSLMHQQEYKFSSMDSDMEHQESARIWYRETQENEIFIPSSDVKFDKEMHSYNAGLLGLPQSFHKRLNDVYYLTELLYPKSLSHAAEQYAFSIVLQNVSEIKTADQYIYHYWPGVEKEIIDKVLSQSNLELIGSDSSYIKEFTKTLPSKISSDYHWLVSNSHQKFYSKKFSEGLKLSLRAFLKQPLGSGKLIKDVIYHIRRKFFLTHE